jgi:hypothetical protein
MLQDNSPRDGDGLVSMRQLLRDEGLRPGVTIRFPQDAQKTEFWNVYPTDEASFRRCVIPESYDEEGIVFSVERTLAHHPRDLKDTYCGLRRDKVARLCFLWQSDEGGFQERHPPEFIQAIQDYLADRSGREAEEKKWRTEEEKRCEPPTPPAGYSWRLEFRLIEKYVLVVDGVTW